LFAAQIQPLFLEIFQVRSLKLLLQAQLAITMATTTIVTTPSSHAIIKATTPPPHHHWHCHCRAPGTMCTRLLNTVCKQLGSRIFGELHRAKR
jgi:hypothetical protein